MVYSCVVSSLSEIEAAASSLPPRQMQELILFLGARLRSGGAQLPPPRDFSAVEIAGWIAEDEEELRQFRSES